PAKPAERSDPFYRFELKLEPNKSTSLDVIEDLPRQEEIALTNLKEEAVRLYLKETALSAEAKKAFEAALKLKGEVEAIQTELQGESNGIRTIEQDQAR